jgi:methionyl-tRNA formyltransferase
VRIVYLGTSTFAAAVLRALAGTPHRPALVVTRPDRPRGRGRKLAAPPVAQAALQLGLAVDQPASVNDEDARARIAAARPQALVVCAFGALIKEPLLSDHEVLNVHPSLLPRWRGAAPIERAMMAGDARTGVCIMRLTAGLDTGPVALSAELAIGLKDTYGTVAERLQPLSAQLLIEVLDAGPGGVAFHEQSEQGVTYADKISAEDRILDPAQPAGELERRVRALTPHIGAAVLMGDGTESGIPGRAQAGERLKVWEAHARPRAEGDPEPGELGLEGELPVLACARDSALVLTQVQPAGRRAMDAAAWLRGRR